MQDGKPKQTSQHKKGKTRAVIACALAAWVLLTCAYVAFICGLLSDNGKNNSSSNTSDYIAYIGADKKEVNISELFRTHLKNRYGGTYYDGEFVVEKIEVTRTLYATGYSTYAYRADIPELKFFMRSSGSEIGTEDQFLEALIAWEGNNTMGDIITDIYGDDILYMVSVSFDKHGDDTRFLRNGYHGLVENHIEDGSFPYVEIVIFTKEFDKNEAVNNIAKLYSIIALGNGVDSFSCSIIYTRSDAVSKGAGFASQSIVFPYMGGDKDLNLFAALFLYYNPDNGDDWTNEYPSIEEYFSSQFRYYE